MSGLPIPKTIYMLFDGTSPDGRGFPDYKGRTTDKKKAERHFRKCERDPCSTGYVHIVTGSRLVKAEAKDFEKRAAT